MEEVARSTEKLPLVVMDAMLPRQTLKIQVGNPTFVHLVRTRVEQETPSFGMLGQVPSESPFDEQQEGMLMTIPKNGVEVTVKSPRLVDKQGNIQLELKAGRRFSIIEGQVSNNEGGWTEAKVEFLDSDRQWRASC